MSRGCAKDRQKDGLIEKEIADEINSQLFTLGMNQKNSYL